MNCAQCGNENTGNAKFCRICGVKLQAQQPVALEHAQNFVQCSKCGYSNEVGKKFCPKCGTSLASTAPSDVAFAATQPPPTLPIPLNSPDASPPRPENPAPRAAPTKAPTAPLDVAPAAPQSPPLSPIPPIPPNSPDAVPPPPENLAPRALLAKRGVSKVVAGSVIAVVFVATVGGGGYWYYQKQETEKTLAAERQHQEIERVRAEAQARVEAAAAQAEAAKAEAARTEAQRADAQKAMAQAKLEKAKTQASIARAEADKAIVQSQTARQRQQLGPAVTQRECKVFLPKENLVFATPYKGECKGELAEGRGSYSFKLPTVPVVWNVTGQFHDGKLNGHATISTEAKFNTEEHSEGEYRDNRRWNTTSRRSSSNGLVAEEFRNGVLFARCSTDSRYMEVNCTDRERLWILGKR